jgi:hypothetical protein
MSKIFGSNKEEVGGHGRKKHKKELRCEIKRACVTYGKTEERRGGRS